MVIRWLGAFGRGHSLAAALRYELEDRDSTDECAAEILLKGSGPRIKHATVGLLVKSSAVNRKFRSDVWSSAGIGCKLKPARGEGKAHSGHTEAFVSPHYSGIVIQRKLKNKAMSTIWKAARKSGLPVFTINSKGELIKLVR